MGLDLIKKEEDPTVAMIRQKRFFRRGRVLLMKHDTYLANGISISKKTLTKDSQVTLSYTGLLRDAGAETVILHTGYNADWDMKEMIPMIKENDVFKADLTLKAEGAMHFVFVESADNWDNNSGNNYSFAIGKKSSKSAEKKVEINEAKEETTVKLKKAPAVKAEDTKPAAKAKKSVVAKTEEVKATEKKPVAKKTAKVIEEIVETKKPAAKKAVKSKTV